MSDAPSDLAVASPTEASTIREPSVKRPHVSSATVPSGRASASMPSTYASNMPAKSNADANPSSMERGERLNRNDVLHRRKARIREDVKHRDPPATSGKPATTPTTAPEERGTKRPSRPSRHADGEGGTTPTPPPPPPQAPQPMTTTPYSRLMPKNPRPSTAHLTYSSAHHCDAPSPLIMSATVDEYREGCLKLEKTRHARVYEAEKRLMYMEHAIMTAYANELRSTMEEHMACRRAAVMKALAENAEKMRRLEEIRYGISKEDTAQNAWTRKHDMALRGRAGEEKARVDDDGSFDPDKPRKTRKTESRHQKVKVHLELDENDILTDLADLRGEKRPREPEPVAVVIQPERKAKKKKS